MDPTAGKILIVDDEAPLLRMMSLYLGRLGYDVATAGTTDQAWTLVEADPTGFAAAVLDASMPGLSMPDLAARLLAANPSLCVLASSGYPVDMSALAAASPGRVEFLLKPFSPEMLAAAVRRLGGAQEAAL